MRRLSCRCVIFALSHPSVANYVHVQAFSSNNPSRTLSTAAPVEEENKPTFAYTNIHKSIIWDKFSPPVSFRSEKSLRESGVLTLRGEFGDLSDARINEVAQAAKPLGITLPQALNIRKQTLVTKITYSNSQLKNQGLRLSYLLRTNGSIKGLSHQIDQPPVAIIREILRHRISRGIAGIDLKTTKKIIRSIIYDEVASPHLEDFLTPLEQEQLELAKTLDVVTYIGQESSQGERDASGAWEQTLYDFLDDQGISYWNEEQLRSAGATSTPDCLLLDDVTINGRPTRWIDCKNFFGYAGAKHFANSMSKQANRYNAYFEAEGAIVYRDGFSAAMIKQVPQALILDRGPLHERIESLFAVDEGL